MGHLILEKLLVQNRDFVSHSKSRCVPPEGDFRCVPCVVNDKPSLICTVKNNVMNVTRYASQGFSSFSLNKSNSIAYICSVYEYGPLQNYIISKFLRKHVLLFPKHSSIGVREVKRRNASIKLLEFQRDNQKSNS